MRYKFVVFTFHSALCLAVCSKEKNGVSRNSSSRFVYMGYPLHRIRVYSRLSQHVCKTIDNMKKWNAARKSTNLSYEIEMVFDGHENVS